MRFRRRVRNDSTHMCIGNGREWKGRGMEDETDVVIPVPVAYARKANRT